MFKIFGENHNNGKSVFDISRNVTVLIIEDDPLCSKLLESSLGKEGYLIYHASSGEDGLKKAAEIFPDVILLDIVLPDLNGFEVCRKIRTDKLLSDVVIVITTSLHDRESKIKGMEAGADEFITKPFDNDELRLKMRSIARMNRYRRIIAERAKFEWAVENSEDGFLIVDESDIITYLNPQARLYLNLPIDSSEIPSQKLSELVLRQYNLEPKEAWEDWMVEKKRNVRRYFIRPETILIGSLWLDIECLEIPQGLNMGRIIRMKDVTNQKYSQARMRSFQSMIYHKLRTPMTSVLGGMEILSQHEKMDMSREELKEYLDETLVNLKRLYVSIEDIFLHQEALRLKGIEDRLTIADCSNLMDYLKEFLNLESIHVKNLITDKTIAIGLSRSALEFALIEILENSKKFHPAKHPEIIIETKLVDKTKVSVKITDDGRTIPPESLNKVWAPYYQVEKIFTGNIAGMGLGLASVATIIWGVGGSCNISNRTDKAGVVVELIIPLLK